MDDSQDSQHYKQEDDNFQRQDTNDDHKDESQNDQQYDIDQNDDNEQIEQSNDEQQISQSQQDDQPKKKEKEDEYYGINTNLYTKPANGKSVSHYTKTGTEFVLLHQNPEFILNCDPFEPLYVPKQDVLENALRKEIEKFCFADTLMNRIVYDCTDPSPFTKDVDPAKYKLDQLPFYWPQSKDDTTLVFESRFECGNLRRAIQICEFEYNLILKPDYYTNGNTQWYYFSISNTRKNQEYRFNIINMMKPDSLYNAGMKPLLYSEKQAKAKKIGWYRDGYEICYYQNNMKRKNGGFYYTLTFQTKFPYNNDTIFFAHCYPYTYTQLCQYINALEKDPVRSHRIRRKTLCQTIAGNNCDYLEISEFKSDFNKDKKKTIMLTSRVHPGESMASYVIEYLIDYLSGNSVEARVLRENFIFYVVPMLNIDGVINGNYRCNLSGVDLNRQWIVSQKSLHPTIYATKILVRKLKDEKNLVFYCDFHGHSRKKNIFMYGCSGKDPNRKELIFPMLMKQNCSVFNFKDCNFQVQRDKEGLIYFVRILIGTARIALWRDLNLVQTYTLEVSFCGADFGKYEYFHFNLDIFREIADAFGQSIIDCYEPDQVKVKPILDEIEQLQLKNDKKDDKNGDSSDGGNSDYSNDDEKNQQATNTTTTDGDKNQNLLIEPPKKFKKKIVTNVKQIKKK